MATYASIKYNFTPPDATISAPVGAGAMKLVKSLTIPRISTSCILGPTNFISNKSPTIAQSVAVNAFPSILVAVSSFDCERPYKLNVLSVVLGSV